jgi:hypothetical protein
MSDEEKKLAMHAHGIAPRSAESPPVPDQLRTEMRPIESVKRYWRNPRSKQNIEKMVNSLNAYGWRQPIVVDVDGVIIVGDTRYIGGQARGDTHVPVWVARDLSKADAAAYRIADNRIAEESEWDVDALTAELKLLQELGFSELAELEMKTGFDPEELDRYLGNDAEGHTLEPVDVHAFPPYTWALIGIPTVRYHEIAEFVEAIAATPDLFCEVTVNDEKP